MIARIIDASIANRFFIVLAAIAVTLAGFWAVRATPVDAIPDLSDVQVVVRSNYPGQAPRIVEDQVTYPLATTMLSVPGAETVRGYSMFGDSFVYVIFEDGTDLYWARSRVLEYLNQVQNELPEGVTSSLGPDATGVGWIYEYALIDRTGNSDLAGLRTGSCVMSSRLFRALQRSPASAAWSSSTRSCWNPTGWLRLASLTAMSCALYKLPIRRPADRWSKWARRSLWSAHQAISRLSKTSDRFR
jgi:Cu/Ag efflux pump CusA